MLGKAIKADSLLQDIQLIMLSSLGQDGDIKERLGKIGFAASLVKPARQSELLETLVNVWTEHCRHRSMDITNDHGPGPKTHEVPISDSPDRPFIGTRVLLAEDNATNQIVGAMMLRNLGCHVDIAANGREAMQMIEKFPYEIVFMDCEMPEMDGYEATAAIRRRTDSKCRLPIGHRVIRSTHLFCIERRSCCAPARAGRSNRAFVGKSDIHLFPEGGR